MPLSLSPKQQGVYNRLEEAWDLRGKPVRLGDLALKGVDNPTKLVHIVVALSKKGYCALRTTDHTYAGIEVARNRRAFKGKKSTGFVII